MGESSDPAFIAIDGGGTSCRVALVIGGQQFTGETGAANVSTDFDGALSEVERGLAGVAAKAGLARDALASIPIYIGIAGVTGPEIAGRIAARLGFDRCIVEDDRPAALRGALGARDGVVAHCGTGSFVAASIGGKSRFAGGWGPVLGDEASAQWLGRRALALTLDSVDGRAERSPMAERFLRDHDGSAGIVRFAGTASPGAFGALAPSVTGFAAKGDPLARRAMQSGADVIAVTVADLGWRDGLALCLTGGLGPHYRDYLPETMQAALLPPEGDPLSGAIALARELATGDAE